MDGVLARTAIQTSEGSTFTVWMAMRPSRRQAEHDVSLLWEFVVECDILCVHRLKNQRFFNYLFEQYRKQACDMQGY